MFWAIAAVALFAAAFVTFWPLLRGKSFWQPAALALLFLLPAGGLWIYSNVGTPEAIDLPDAQVGQPPGGAGGASAEDIDAMIDSLRSRLTRTPERLDGWVLLARTLKTLQRYPEAREALEVAHGIAPDDPLVMVELAEARVFTSADGRIDELSVAMLERAVELDPSQQKGLWLLGIASAQAGDDAFAVSYWESLLQQLEPGSTVAQSVQAQVNEARARMGMTVETPVEAPVATASEAAPAVAAAVEPPAQSVGDAGSASPDSETADWSGTDVRVLASDAARAAIPAGAVLFVVVRSPGPAAGPPLGVRRIADPQFPIELTVSDRDSMMAQRPISLESEVQLQARVSLSGSPAARPGDWQSAAVNVALNAAGTVELNLDQRVE
jgi:cytochrome c-type biogenesis protein CcmH